MMIDINNEVSGKLPFGPNDELNYNLVPGSGGGGG